MPEDGLNPTIGQGGASAQPAPAQVALHQMLARLSQTRPPAQGEVYISFLAPVTQVSAEALIGAVAQQVAQGASAVHLMMSTPGGQVDAGITVFNALVALPVRLMTYNMGSVDSIGNVIFLAGAERYACTNSRFMFHGVAFDAPQGLRLDERTLDGYLAAIQSDQARIAGIVQSRTNIDAQKLKGLFREAAFLTPVEAMEFGIVHDVKDVTVPAGAPFLQLVFK